MQNTVLPIGTGLFLVQVEFWIRSLNELVAVLYTGSHLSDLGI